jgi:hypothetical protein
MSANLAFPTRKVVAVIRWEDGEERVSVVAFAWNHDMRVAEALILGEHYLWPADAVSRVGGEFVRLEEVVIDATDGRTIPSAPAVRDSGCDPDGNPR